MDRFSIVLVNYKTRRLTAICLELIRSHFGPDDVDVIVVDNESADDSVEYLRSLDWITLIERSPGGPEEGHFAHGRALDLALQQVRTRHLFCFHTDTFLHDPAIIRMMLVHMVEGVVAVGTTEQVQRAWHSTAWRAFRRGSRFLVQRGAIRLGLREAAARPWREIHLKSFCCLWDVTVIRREQLQFSMGILNPGYVMQDQLQARGYKIVVLPPSTVFRYLDHVQSGTLVETGDHSGNRRRTSQYRKILARFDQVE